MSGDNGDSIKETVALDELILAVKRGKDGQIETMVSPATRAELEVALMRITHLCYGIFNAMSHEAQQSKIVQPKGSIINFARRMK